MRSDALLRWSALGIGMLLAATPVYAQRGESPLANFILAGYGSAANETSFETGLFVNDFTASLSPVLLYQMGENFLFEAELEFGLSGELTTTSLEYAQVDYLGLDRVVITAGKFLMPFGLFSERYHPTWVNKLANAPRLYGHAHGGVAEESLLPVLSDAGVMLRYAQPLSTAWGLDVTLFVTQGPRLASADEVAHEDEEPHALVAMSVDPDHADGTASFHDEDIPLLAFGTSFADNNDNKLIGARIGVVRGPTFEVHVSGFHAMYDPDNFLDLLGGNLALELRRGRTELRGEAIVLRQEFQVEDAFETVTKPGYYVQAARRFGSFEPVLRWAQLLDWKVDGTSVRDGQDFLGAGLAYWFAPSVPVKLMYEWDSAGPNRVLLEWAFGF